MATTKVIATTWAKKDLVAKLKETLKRMDAEIVEWDRNHKTIKKRQDAWDKKAEAWAKKNVSKASKVEFFTGGYNGPHVEFLFDEEELFSAVGERPKEESKPDYKDTNYSNKVSTYEQVENAIALIEGSTDVEYKINTTSAWATFIR
jgi:hypothetical protein